MVHGSFFLLFFLLSDFYQSLGLIIPRGLCVSGLTRSSRTRDRSALTEKAWENAVQGLGKIRLSIVWKSNRAKNTPSVKLENFFNFIWA